MNPKDPKFLKLQARWYAKLAKKGFEDIEQDETRLKKWSETFFKRSNLNQSNINVVTAKLDYYSLCRQFLSDHKFKNKVEKKMFEMHTEGIGAKIIAAECKTYTNKVQKIINEYLRIMRGK